MSVPVRLVGGKKWGDLSVFGEHHEVCGERVKERDAKFSFAGGHRLRLYSFRKTVHFRIMDGMNVDISGIDQEGPPPRRHQR